MMNRAMPILPPFPFPERWSQVKVHQSTSGDLRWSTPSQLTADTSAYMPEQSILDASVVERGQFAVTQESSWNMAHVALPEQPEEQEEAGEQFVLSEEWAARFSKTLKRKKRKTHREGQKLARKEQKV